MKKFLSTLLGIVMLTTLMPSTMAQQLPTVPATALGGLVGYTASYISGGPYGGDILIAGGVRDGVYQSGALLYDPAAGQMEVPDESPIKMGAPRAFHTATTLSDGRILFFGGESAPNTYLTVAEMFDPATFAFQPVAVTGADLPHAQRKRHAATFFYILGNPEQYVLITGGCTAACSGADTLRDSLIFRVSDNAFMAGPLMHQARQDQQATYLPAAGGRGIVMLIGGSAQAEYFDIDTFKGTAGSGQFVQDATVQQLIDENQVLLNAGKSVESVQEQTALFNNVPAAVTGLLQTSKTPTTTPATQSPDVLQKQLEDLDRLQKSINSLRIPSATQSVIASDTRGRVMTSGAFVPPQDFMHTASGSLLSQSDARTSVLAQQDKLARMLRGDFSASTGFTMPTLTSTDSYGSDFTAFTSGLSEEHAALLQSLTPEARDSDGDGLTDQVERDANLDPFQQDTNKDGISDLDAFLGSLPTMTQPMASWPEQPLVSTVCANDGALWGRTLPEANLGVFQQSGSGTRFQMGKGTADATGVFVLPIATPLSDSALSMVIRTQDGAGVFQYSAPRQVRVVPCLPTGVVMLDTVHISHGERLLEGRATAGSLVFLRVPGFTMVAKAKEDGTFTAQLGAALPAGAVELQTWSVLNGESGSLRIYPLDIPLPPTGSGTLLSSSALHASAAENEHPLFWWLYTLGLLGGVSALAALAFDLRRRYSGVDSTLLE